MAMTNATLWDELRGKYPSFASHTSKATAELFTEKGYEALARTDVEAINEFFLLSVRTKLIGIDASEVTNRLESSGFGESFDVPFGGILQKMAVFPFKPNSPKYKGLKNGNGPDPGRINKPNVTERFWQQNFDYQSFGTMPDDSLRKNIFISEYGMSDFTSAFFTALQDGYKIQTYVNTLECINKGVLNAEKYPLKDTQKLNVTLSATPTDEELRAFVLAVNNAVSAMELDPQTDAYNAYSFPTAQDRSRLKLLIRPGIKTAIANIPALNAPGLGLPIDVIEVPNFGGIEYYQDKALTKKLYPYYDEDGREDGWTATEGGTTKYTGEVYTKDPNASVIGLIADKGIIFHGIQNPYTVEPFRNPAGLYTTFWASSPNNTIAADPIKNCMAIYKA